MFELGCSRMWTAAMSVPTRGGASLQAAARALDVLYNPTAVYCQYILPPYFPMNTV